MAKRQIGQCEAIYRVLPELKLKKTNVHSMYVPSGFPKSISHFLKRMSALLTFAVKVQLKYSVRTAIWFGLQCSTVCGISRSKLQVITAVT